MFAFFFQQIKVISEKLYNMWKKEKRKKELASDRASSIKIDCYVGVLRPFNTF